MAVESRRWVFTFCRKCLQCLCIRGALTFRCEEEDDDDDSRQKLYKQKKSELTSNMALLREKRLMNDEGRTTMCVYVYISRTIISLFLSPSLSQQRGINCLGIQKAENDISTSTFGVHRWRKCAYRRELFFAIDRKSAFFRDFQCV